MLILILLFAQAYVRLPFPHDKEWFKCNCKPVHYEFTLTTDKRGEATVKYSDLYPADYLSGKIPVVCSASRKPGDAYWNLIVKVKSEDREHQTVYLQPRRANFALPYQCDMAVPK